MTCHHGFLKIRRFMSECTQRATCTLQGHFRKWPKCPPTILYLFTETLFIAVTLFPFFFFIFLNHGNSDPSVKTSPGINSISDEGFLFEKQSRLWANHHLQKLTKKINHYGSHRRCARTYYRHLSPSYSIARFINWITSWMWFQTASLSAISALREPALMSGWWWIW